MSKKIQLVSQGGATSIHIDAQIDNQGDLLLSGQDIGEAPERIFGKDEYEYWLTIPSAQKDRLLLALIDRFYRGNASVISELRELLESQDIQHNFRSF